MSGNPALTNVDRKFEVEGRGESAGVMTMNGVVTKTAGLVAVVLVAGVWTYGQARLGTDVMPWFWLGFVVSLVAGFTMIFAPTTSPYLAAPYAAAEGVTLGIISAMTDRAYPGLAIQALLGTSVILVTMLIIYRTGLIRNSQKFTMGLSAAMMGIVVIYAADLILGFFNIHVPVVNDSSAWGILFSGAVVIIAALNFVIDFDAVEKGVAARAPSYVEWYCAVGLIMTLVWLYLEILRLLSKLRDDND